MRKEDYFRKAIWYLVLVLTLATPIRAFAGAMGDILHQKAVSLAREGKFELAIPLMEEARKETDNGFEVLCDYIVILAWAGQFEKALRIYETLPPEPVLPVYLLSEVARSYRFTGDHGRAIRLYQYCLESKGPEPETSKGLIQTYLDAGLPDLALQHIDNQRKIDRELGEGLQLYLAGNFPQRGESGQAELLYRRSLDSHPDREEARLGLVRALAKNKKFEEAETILGPFLKNNPRHIDALFFQGELREAQEEYIAAYHIYGEISKLYPDSLAARNLKYRALMKLGAQSLAEDKLRESEERVGPEIRQMLWGNQAMTRIHWDETTDALGMLEENLSRAGDVTWPANYPLDDNAKFILRTHFDRLLTLRRREEMKEVLEEYGKLKEMKVELPPWLLKEVASAYLYREKPGEALALYREVLARGWDPGGDTRMAIYHTLVELGRYREAGALLEELDRESPVRVVRRGILQDNWRKAEIAVNRGWWLLYQDRKAEPQEYLQELLFRAPFNAHPRITLAQAYLWRGWPRRARDEFEIIRNLDPQSVPAAIGYCYALNEVDRGAEARRLGRDILKKNPKNKHAQRLKRDFELQDMRLLTLQATGTQEDPGVHGFYLEAKFDQPLAPDRKLFAGFIWRDYSQETYEERTRRGYLGADWRLSRDWWVKGTVSADRYGEDAGFAGQVTFKPNDYLSLNGFYESYSLEVPLRAYVRGVESEEWSFSARYRRSESFLVEGGGSRFEMSDGNDRWTGNLKLEQALSTGAYWKTRCALEGYGSTSSRTDVDYFSPEYLCSAYLIPMVEHTWFRRYQKALVDKLYLGLGMQKQKDISGRILWYVRYQQDYDLSDWLAIIIGGTYSRKNYDGDYVNEWNYYLTLKTRF